LIDASITARRQLIDRFRAHGWRGSILWVPITLLAVLVVLGRAVRSLVRFELPSQLAVWSILRPRRYDPRLSTAVLGAATQLGEAKRSGEPVSAVESPILVSEAQGSPAGHSDA